MQKTLLRAGTIALVLLTISCATGNESGLPLPGFGDTQQPAIAVAGLADGATVSGTVAVSGAASDNVGVTSFTLSIDGTQVASSDNGALAHSWVTTGVANGAHTLVFSASDAAGNTATSTLNVTVNNNGGGGGGGDTEDPVITVTGINNDSEVFGVIYITASATDNVGISTFTLTIDGNEEASSFTGSLNYTFDTTSLTNAPHSLAYSATDAAGNVSTRTFNITVNNPSTTSSVSGTVYAPNGSDPVSGAQIYVLNKSAAAAGDPPNVSYVSYTYSEPDGTFSLAGVPLGAQTIIFVKGAFEKSLEYDVQPGVNVLSPGQTTLANDGGEVSDILVVTGNYDYIQNTLAKLGLGDVNEFGYLVLGTEKFKLVDGNESLDNGAYQNFDQFFAVPANFDQYRTIFLNCGNIYEDDFFANSAAVAALKAWVEAGGRLYCTDWSYNFIEQLWADRIDFDSFSETGDGLAATPEERDFAKTGDGMDDLLCHIEDSGLAAWMAAIGASTAGDNFNTVDWLSGWVPMDAVAASVKVWATGTPPDDVNRPMTVTFAAGDGTVLFSSYHTEETPTTEVTPQERVLQYLIFEVL